MLLRKSFVTPKELFYVRNHDPYPGARPSQPAPALRSPAW
jgi:hypothetical protein